jgi:uncharacterized integral membrane protein
MKLRGVVYIVAALVIGVLVVANWSLFTTPVDLNFLAARLQAPLIIPVLLIAGVILLLDAGLNLMNRQAWARERRALARDLEGARLRAEREEESRIGALRTTLDRELAAIRAQLDQLLAIDSELRVRVRAPNETRVEPRVEPRRNFEPELIPPQVGDGRGVRVRE